MSTSALVITSDLDRRGIPGVWLLRKGRDRLRYCVLVGGQNSGECGKISFLGKYGGQTIKTINLYSCKKFLQLQWVVLVLMLSWLQAVGLI